MVMSDRLLTFVPIQKTILVELGIHLFWRSFLAKGSRRNETRDNTIVSGSQSFEVSVGGLFAHACSPVVTWKHFDVNDG
jgi:hypothetical protein